MFVYETNIVLENVGDVFKKWDLRQRTSSKHHWPLCDSDVRKQQTCLEIKGLTEFWFKIYASKNSAYQTFIFHHLKIQRPGDKARTTYVHCPH